MSKKYCQNPRPHDEHLWQEVDPETPEVAFEEGMMPGTTSEMKFLNWVCDGNRYWVPMERS